MQGNGVNTELKHTKKQHKKFRNKNTFKISILTLCEAQVKHNDVKTKKVAT